MLLPTLAHASDATAQTMRGRDGVVVNINNFKNGQDLYLGFGKSVYYVGSGSERKMNCTFKSGRVVTPPNDGI